jgi:hypothetical protein
MNIEKLKEAEHNFLMKYPGGFNHPDMLVISKKHKPEKMKTLARESFAEELFDSPDLIMENMIKVITRSSMVSVFEKPKFRDYARMIRGDERSLISRGLHEMLYGDQHAGFDMMLEILKMGKLGKWTLMTICPVYFKPQSEVYVKPTTAKNVIRHFEIDDLAYSAKPTYEFYMRYRDVINSMKDKIDRSLSPDNAAFTGFLMMSSDLS